jgi:hypothetical protein
MSFEKQNHSEASLRPRNDHKLGFASITGFIILRLPARV